MAKAVVLLSGGMDSATALAVAKSNACNCFALSIDYGQRSQYELQAAQSVAEHLGVLEHKILTFDLTHFGGSALTDKTYSIPESEAAGIPITYVPARNTIFFSLALAWSEAIGAKYIYSGVNAVDYSGYPDCRPEYIKAYEEMANLATKQSIDGHRLTIHTPLIDQTKAQIIKQGLSLGVDYSQTISCYQANKKGEACGECDACVLRQNGFAQAGVVDPTKYQ